MNMWYNKEEKIKRFLLSIGEAGKIADKVSDLIVFHNRVAKNAKKQYVWNYYTPNVELLSSSQRYPETGGKIETDMYRMTDKALHNQ